jgi:predicted nuclease of predicted toxin-antitoxin system
MKILLDENIPVKLKHAFGDIFQVLTVSETGWNGKKNGALMQLMTQHHFDGLVTLDKNLQYQQNIARINITIFVLQASNNKIQTLLPFVQAINTFNPKHFKPGILSIEV